MRSMRSTLALSAALCAALFALLALSACGGEPGIERVDVTWVSLDPPPRWGLYPGYRQEVQFKSRSAYRVDVHSGGKVVTGGTVGDTGSSLVFLPAAGARDIEAQAAGRDALTIYATLKNDKGESRRLVCLKVERKDDKIWFEVPKQ
ncbi:MAG: hypothetical protein AB9900_03205 [Humidesulfovibrio sp.]